MNRCTGELFRLLLRRGIDGEDAIRVMDSELSNLTGATLNVSSISVESLVLFIDQAVGAIKLLELQRYEKVQHFSAKNTELNQIRRSAQLERVRSFTSKVATAYNQTLSEGNLSVDSVDNASTDAEPEHLKLLRRLRWPLVIAAVPAFKYAFLHLPTLFSGRIIEEELIQFAEIVTVIEPSYMKALSSVPKNVLVRKFELTERAKSRTTLSRQVIDFDVQDAKLEAHQHAHVLMPDGMFKCVICLQKQEEARATLSKDFEKNWRSEFEFLCKENERNYVRSLVDDGDHFQKSLSLYSHNPPAPPSIRSSNALEEVQPSVAGSLVLKVKSWNKYREDDYLGEFLIARQVGST